MAADSGELPRVAACEVVRGRASSREAPLSPLTLTHTLRIATPHTAAHWQLRCGFALPRASTGCAPLLPAPHDAPRPHPIGLPGSSFTRCQTKPPIGEDIPWLPWPKGRNCEPGDIESNAQTTHTSPAILLAPLFCSAAAAAPCFGAMLRGGHIHRHHHHHLLLLLIFFILASHAKLFRNVRLHRSSVRAARVTASIASLRDRVVVCGAPASGQAQPHTAHRGQGTRLGLTCRAAAALFCVVWCSPARVSS